jgi:hypothetical protein
MHGLPGPIVRRRDTGEVLNIPPQATVKARAAYDTTPEGKEAAQYAKEQMRALAAEEARARQERLERELQAVTSLDVNSVPGQFNVLFAALYELNPEFRVTQETNLGNLYEAVIEARPQWFTAPEIAEEDFWATLHRENVPKCQYFTSLDQHRFTQTHPDLEAEGYTLRELLDWLENEKADQPVKEPTQSTSAYDFHTGEEFSAFVRAAADGKSGANYRNEEQRGVRLWECKDVPHRVEVPQMQPDGSQLTFEALKQFTQAQNFDAAYALFYVCGVLSPPGAEKRRLVGGWIDLNDVMKHIGWMAEKPNAERREKLRADIWEFIKFGGTAWVTGERSRPYRDPVSKQIIPTQINSAPWQITDVERPEDNPIGAPIRVHIVISQQWTPLLTSPHLTQYLPLGELLAEIPPHQISGDWARVIGYTLGQCWRIKPRETQARTYSPTRRALLTTYTPKTKTVSEVINSKNPKRVIEYYLAALQHLADGGFIAREGDGAETLHPEKMIAQYNGYKWAAKWLDEPSGLFLGKNWQNTIEERAKALPSIKPRDLNAKPKKRRKKQD